MLITGVDFVYTEQPCILFLQRHHVLVPPWEQCLLGMGDIANETHCP